MAHVYGDEPRGEVGVRSIAAVLQLFTVEWCALQTILVRECVMWASPVSVGAVEIAR